MMRAKLWNVLLKSKVSHGLKYLELTTSSRNLFSSEASIQVCCESDNTQPFSKVVYAVSTYLKEKGATPEHLNKFVADTNFGNVHQFQCKLCIDFLMNYGFVADSIIKIIFKYPSALAHTPQTLDATLDAIQQCGVPSQALLTLIPECPEVLGLNPQVIRSRLASLMTIFTQNDISKLCSLSLSILLYPVQKTEEKLQYFIHRMGLEHKQLLNSKAFLHSLDHIVIRHNFLLRVGLYTMPSPKAPHLVTNPSLKKILDTNDEVFATKVAQVSLEEYKLFCKLVLIKRIVLDTENFGQNEEEDDDDD